MTKLRGPIFGWSKTNLTIKLRKLDLNTIHRILMPILLILKKTWKGINCLVSNKKTACVIDKIFTNNVTIKDPADISNAFNNHFTDIGPSLASNITSNNSINYDRIATPANSNFMKLASGTLID